MYSKNQDYFNSMNRYEYATLPNKLRNIIFKNIDSKKVVAIWQEKFDNLLKSNYLDQKKKSVISAIKYKLEPNMFSNVNTATEFTKEIFLNFEKHGFTNEEIFVSVYTLYNINNSGTLENIITSRPYQLTHADGNDCGVWSCYLPIACGGNE